MLKLIKSKNDSFSEIYEDMKCQFPQNELNAFAVYENLLKKEVYGLYKAFDGENAVGYCLMCTDDENSVLWLEFIAVFEQFHSMGYGKKIFSNLADNFSGFKGIYLEVESPDALLPNTLRRIKFYESLGAVKIDCSYFLPNYDGCIPLDLYFLPFGDFVPNKEMTFDTINKVFEAIHSHHSHLGEVLEKIK